MRPAGTTRFKTTKAYDVLVGAPLILFYGLSVAGLRPQFAAALSVHPVWSSALQVLALVSDVCYFTLVVVLILIRRMPVAKSRGIHPRLVALLAANLLILVAWLPKVALSPLLASFAAALTGGGTLAELGILLWLGRSFTILPEARRLVTRGPYRFVRHPLYLVSIIASLGVIIQFEQPWAFLIVMTADVLQIVRIRYEESVLREAFPEYADYVARTARLIPGVY